MSSFVSSHPPPAKIHRIIARGSSRHYYNVSIHTRPVRRELRACLRKDEVRP